MVQLIPNTEISKRVDRDLLEQKSIKLVSRRLRICRCTYALSYSILFISNIFLGALYLKSMKDKEKKGLNLRYGDAVYGELELELEGCIFRLYATCYTCSSASTMHCHQCRQF